MTDYPNTKALYEAGFAVCAYPPTHTHYRLQRFDESWLSPMESTEIQTVKVGEVEIKCVKV